MRRIYLLVQNNVRTGPFTLEELLQQSLHSNGLVWIIGQSEDWFSPLEIPSLAPYYIQNPDGTFAVKETVLADIRAKRFIDPLDLDSVADQRQGVLDAQFLKEPPEEDITIESALEDSGSHYQETETKVSLPNEPVQAQREGSSVRKIVNEKEDDNLTIARKNWAVVGIAALLVLFITWNALFNDGTKEKHTRSSTVSSMTEKERLVDNTSFEAVAPDEKKQIIASSESPRKESNHVSAPATSTDAFLDSVQRVMAEQEQLMANVDDVYRKSFLYRKRHPQKQVAASTTRNANQRSTRSNAAIKQTTTAPKVPLSQQVDLQSRLVMDKNKQQVSAVELRVKNNSGEVLKTVSVDVYYYKNGQKLLNKETVYFTNIYPKQLMTMSVAGNQRATSARSQLGLVSTGKN